MNNTNIVIILLLVANLAATIWFGSNTNTPVTQKPYEQASEHELPSVITSQVKSNLLNTFIEHFNNSNYDALYDMFGPVAKAQLAKEEMNGEFRKLTKFFHKIESGTFGFAQFSGQKGSTTVYVLNYPVKLSKQSEFGENGILKITLAIDANEYQVYGIYLHGNTNT